MDRETRAGAMVDSVVLPPVAERTVTPADIEAAGGLTVTETAELMEALGFIAPDARQAAFTPEEAEALVEMARVGGLFGADLRIRSARRYGRHLARLAHGDVQQFHDFVEPSVSVDGDDPLAALEAVQAALVRLVDIAMPWLAGVYRRWLEHELSQAVVGQIETQVGGERLPGAVDVTVAYCDLKDFTAYADRHGDAAALEAIEQFIEVVERERGDRVRVMKTLGDGVLLVYDDPAAAVRAVAAVAAAMDDGETPGVHASLHRGIAITRDGDYFGGVVNIASRLLSHAQRHQVLATAAVVDSVGDEFSWRSAGTLRVRGVRDPVETFLLT